ncbi:MAG TPA: M28 family peptidase [Bryobacteraceae bacterium]|nr:M28 family peptidase [Bryobacteraceae bacterium]
MRKTAQWILLFSPLALLAADVNSDAYLAHIKYLASPELKGRATGSPELEKAAAYIAGQFQSFGLKPVSGKSYELAFPAELGAKLGTDNAFTFSDAGAKQTLKEGQDFVPFNFSTNGKFNGAVVFAGYGITAKEYNYDDYAGIDVKDKLVLILRHEPQESDDKSIFGGKKLTEHATFISKMVNAKMHGARGVILINDVAAHATADDKLEKFGSNGGPRDAGIFFVQIKAAEAERWLRAEGRDLRQIEKEIDSDLRPQSFALAKVNVDLSVDLIHETKTVHNVAAYLPGKTAEYVIIGAHYDHLGLGDEHSLAPNQMGVVHPGADDNASGTAGVIELARWFSKQPQPQRGILFMTFAGEELGLLGSNWYVNHPALPEGNAVAMLNLDMIGRVQGGKVFVSGAQTGTTLGKILEEVKPPAPLRIDESGKNSGTNMSDASDHASFASKQIPVLFFFSGLHADYHKPSDTADKIDAVDAAKLLDYVADIATHLADDADRPTFVRVARPPAGPVSGGGGGVSGYGPDFGSIPDFNEPPKGVRFADIREGSPAAKAGLKPGDIMIEFAGKPIGNLYDFTYALRDSKAGDIVLVKVLRGDQTIDAKVLLTERR